MAAPLDRRLLHRATAAKIFLVAVGATGILNGVAVVAQAWLIAHLVAGVFDTGGFHAAPLPGFTAGLWCLATVFVVRAVLVWATSRWAHRASAAVKSQLRIELMRARLKRPSDATTTSSQLIHLVTQGLDALDGYFAKFLPQMMIAIFVPAGIWVIITITDWVSGIIVAITIPLVIVFMVLIGLATRSEVDKRLAAQTKLANHFADLVTGLPTLQVFGRAKAQSKGLEVTEQAARTSTMKTLAMAFASGGVLEFIATLSVALIAVNVGFRTVDGAFDLATALFVLMLAPEAYLPIRQVGAHFHDSADGTAAAQMALDIIDAAERPIGVIDAAGLGAITVVFENVGVHHEGAARPSLSGLNLELSPGRTVVLVGASGAGKSTALSVLMGFTTPTTGRVTVCGVDLADLDPESWRSRIAWVSQDPGMVRGTISSNVRMGNPGADDDAVRSALDRCGAESLALDRPIADDGEGLSAGERRRVAMARALLRVEAGGVDLLVLDEPTAGLDQTTETRVVELVRSMGVLVVAVTHRDALLSIADEIVEVGSGVRS
ncbi:thiol reductant ABC exporter, CydD subunit [Propionibacterium sp. oral taxon 192 str. F0372]|uniref:thiol reductant ABC exporter subunit CydD n=1 Tax=Propionibacterium sp. oral taxon 192 TaxID=671222 RepID=UPI000352A0A6|nr:thiol reductant ABC exporter subunit CydD [Propionibacterium sp. oral taxon 192]EPH03733.1 thiol reductant ABC exporter, CydD subunit [Propionibacterium sp. oral taxon 192 str. F0372]